MHTGNQKQMNASYQASLVNRHIRRFTGILVFHVIMAPPTFPKKLHPWARLEFPILFLVPENI